MQSKCSAKLISSHSPYVAVSSFPRIENLYRKDNFPDVKCATNRPPPSKCFFSFSGGLCLASAWSFLTESLWIALLMIPPSIPLKAWDIVGQTYAL